LPLARRNKTIPLLVGLGEIRNLRKGRRSVKVATGKEGLYKNVHQPPRGKHYEEPDEPIDDERATFLFFVYAYRNDVFVDTVKESDKRDADEKRNNGVIDYRYDTRYKAWDIGHVLRKRQKGKHPKERGAYCRSLGKSVSLPIHEDYYSKSPKRLLLGGNAGEVNG